MKLVTILLAVIGGLGLLFAEAATPDTRRFQDPCITHDGVAELDQLVGQALDTLAAIAGIQDCGEGGDIFDIHWNPDLEDHVLAVAWPRFNGGDWYAIDCWIEVNPNADWQPGHLELVVLHEVLHCLGFSHVDDRPSLMNRGCCTPLNEDDVAMIAARYPVEVPTYQLPTITQPGYVGWNHPTVAIRDLQNPPSAIYLWDGTTWLHWYRDAPMYTWTLWHLDPGVSYWVVP